MKLLGVQIANGYASEARVFASLLAHRPQHVSALVVAGIGPHDRQSAARFEADSGVRVETVDFGWRPSPPRGHSASAKMAQLARLHAALPRALNIARTFAPDIVYSSQQHWDCYVATRLAKALKRPHVIHLHYVIGPWLRRIVLTRLRHCNRVVAVSDFIRADAMRHGLSPERVTTIRNAMTLLPAASAQSRQAFRAEIGISAAAPLVGIAARLAPGKGQEDTIAAFANVVERFQDARLVIAGDGETRPVLERQIERLNLAEHVLLLGRRSDIPRFLGAVDIFCHPSRSDPCPLAVLEAQAAGLPVVAYAEGGACEIVVDGVTGWLVPAGDLRLLAEALGCLVEDRGRAAGMGRAARERIERDFQPRDAALRFADLLGEVAAVGGRAPWSNSVQHRDLR